MRYECGSYANDARYIRVREQDIEIVKRQRYPLFFDLLSFFNSLSHLFSFTHSSATYDGCHLVLYAGEFQDFLAGYLREIKFFKTFLMAYSTVIFINYFFKITTKYLKYSF